MTKSVCGGVGGGKKELLDIERELQTETVGGKKNVDTDREIVKIPEVVSLVKV